MQTGNPKNPANPFFNEWKSLNYCRHPDLQHFPPYLPIAPQQPFRDPISDSPDKYDSRQLPPIAASAITIAPIIRTTGRIFSSNFTSSVHIR